MHINHLLNVSLKHVHMYITLWCVLLLTSNLSYLSTGCGLGNASSHSFVCFCIYCLNFSLKFKVCHFHLSHHPLLPSQKSLIFPGFCDIPFLWFSYSFTLIPFLTPPLNVVTSQGSSLSTSLLAVLEYFINYYHLLSSRRELSALHLFAKI